ncbi:Cytochrome b5 reductase 4 [Orchesella cincta]|uniref:Cytochrome b5 reductase 4 n=1 Tax=Orchesella cincta TaxID=48709 RepID=A0A1D2N157_ORCCI|nr:Cytochrome b5 reductase 4 [Orchesella cincta]
MSGDLPPENVISISAPPIVIKLEEETNCGSNNGTSISLPMEVEEEGNSGSNGSISFEQPGNDGVLSVSKSFLGSDLLQKSASLAMPPPSSTTVKKARNLVNPGMSMVKWMKLQEERETTPTRKQIPLSEIAKHDTETDCWLVIRNCVYDVTEYLPYHPGGIPELMKGAGKDATALFNEVHRWVNFDSILRSCLLGYLKIDDGESFDESEEEVVRSSLVPLNTTVLQTSSRPHAKFFQDDSVLIFQVEAMEDDELTEDSWSVSVLNRERFLLKVILKPPDLWMAHVKLLQALQDDSITIDFQNSFRKARITIKKPSIGKWKTLGTPLQDNNLLLDSRQCQVDDFCCGTVIEKQELTHNVILLGVQTLSSSFVGVPVGFNIKLRIHETGTARKYTPVNRSIIGELSRPQMSEENRRVVYFIIKVYPDGLLTRELGLLTLSSQLEMGTVAGRYDHSFLKNCDTLALFAGGSGITPFVRIVDFLGQRSISYPVKRIMLIFFNHIEADIIWRDEWMQLADSWNVFHFFPVVSSPVSGWNGLLAE